MIKYGIKIWSINEGFFTEAVNLYEKSQVDFIELYLAPDKIPESVKKFKNIDMQIHAPHSGHEFNIFKLNREKIDFFKNQIIKTANLLNVKNIIVHAGVGKDKLIFQKNIKLIADERILIENKPKEGLNSELCFGYSLDQLTFIKNECGFKICLDFGHAIKSAASQEIDYKIFLAGLLNKLTPDYFHISDGFHKNIKDEHLDLGQGNFDLRWIKKMLNNISRDREIKLVFEAPKNINNLDNDIKNINYFKGL